MRMQFRKISVLLLTLDVTDDSGHHSSEVQLLQHLSPEERHSVLNTAAAADIEDLEQFGRYTISCTYRLSKSLCYIRTMNTGC